MNLMNLKYLLAVAAIFVFFSFASAQENTQSTVKNSNNQNVITDADAAKNALNVGAKMPSFSLKDSNDKTVNSDELLKESNLVIVFYRGAWCPFCNLYLRNLQKNINQIREAGGNVIAISAEPPDKSLAVSKKNEVMFPVLSDPQLGTARKFGIVYNLPAETAERYKSRGVVDFQKDYGMEKAELPLGATFIVNQKGEIVYAYLDTDYKKRAEPEIIIENLKKIKN